jgi:2-polyprenyl-3-methyl-5-hydroxy-6-metoxy-1,4-benzoquinol methylase
VEGRSVLDAGTGPGYGAAILREAGAIYVQAVDVDEPSIAAATTRYSIPNLEFIVDDCEKLEKVRTPVDVICSFENIEHLRGPENFLKAATRILSSSGILLVSSPDRGGTCPPWIDGKPSNPYHFFEWYRDEFECLLSKYFRKVDLRTQAVSHAAIVRRQATDNLRQHLKYLWTTPLTRFFRGLGGLMGRTYPWPDIEGLSADTVYDYPILSESAVKAVGRAVSHYAICTDPRK